MLAHEVFVMSTRDFSSRDEDREFFRWVTVEGRPMAQGHRKELAAAAPSQALALSGTGNAFPVPMLGGVLVPMRPELAGSGIVKEEVPGFVLSVPDLVRLTARACALRHLGNIRSPSDDKMLTER